MFQINMKYFPNVSKTGLYSHKYILVPNPGYDCLKTTLISGRTNLPPLKNNCKLNQINTSQNSVITKDNIPHLCTNHRTCTTPLIMLRTASENRHPNKTKTLRIIPIATKEATKNKLIIKHNAGRKI